MKVCFFYTLGSCTKPSCTKNRGNRIKLPSLGTWGTSSQSSSCLSNLCLCHAVCVGTGFSPWMHAASLWDPTALLVSRSPTEVRFLEV